MMRTLVCLVLFLSSGALSSGALSADDIHIVPPLVHLSGSQASQRLLILKRNGSSAIADLTPQGKITSSNPKVADIDANGTVRPIGDGEATLTAITSEGRATAKVVVTKAKSERPWNFRIHVLPILTRLGCNSGACHGALAGKGGFKLSLRGYAPAEDHFVLTRQALSRRVDRQQPSHSLMLLKSTLALPHGGGQKLDVDSLDYRILADWIASGALGLAANDPVLTRLEVFPPHALLKPKDAMPLVVRATYSDGHAEDVTRWAKFTSSEDLVATVDDNGQVKVAGHGEAAINVWFSDHVVAARIVSPFANKLPADTFVNAAKAGFIDALVLKKLEQLNLPPSPGCSDSEFIRRAFLDAIGTLPRPDDIETFLRDARPDRRSRLIEHLLQRSEYVDYWSYRWADLLLISSRKLSQPAVRSFAQFVRLSVADNKPWNQFARDILTAKGSNLHNGATNYFVLHKDISDLTETTTVTFLGTSVTCARCHNHPLEKWTQDQYWGLANLFAQVAVKNGDRAGEFTIHSLSDGDALHPKRGVPITPAPLDGRPAPAGADRREVFAAWLTAPENPYFARALVNRVWKNFMGRGLVESEDDVRQTNPASNEELLTALAADFVKHGYDVKHLIRQVMNSAAYQRSSRPLAENKSDDRYYSRYIVRRLPAEVVLDAFSDVTRVPTAFTRIAIGTSGGDAKTEDFPLGTRAQQLPDTQLVSQFLDAFGRPERGQPCACERQSESSVTQALHLNNGQTLNDRLRDKRSRVEDWLKEKIGDDEAIRRVFLLCLSRAPSNEEQARFRALLAEAAAEPGTGRREALEDLFWAVLTGREFLFNH